MKVLSIVSDTKIYNEVKKMQSSPSRLAPLVKASVGCGFHFQSGHIPRLRFEPWLVHVLEATD